MVAHGACMGGHGYELTLSLTRGTQCMSRRLMWRTHEVSWLDTRCSSGLMCHVCVGLLLPLNIQTNRQASAPGPQALKALELQAYLGMLIHVMPVQWRDSSPGPSLCPHAHFSQQQPCRKRRAVVARGWLPNVIGLDQGCSSSFQSSSYLVFA